MNRTLLLARFSMSAALFLCAALFRPPAANAQYIYLDTNGDGVHTDADIVNPSGTTTIAIWLDTGHDKDGTLQSCNSHTGAPHSYGGTPPDPVLDIFSYDVYLVVTDGTVTWGDFEDHMGFENFSPPDGRDPSKLHAAYFIPTGEFGRPAGLHKLGEITATVQFGTPSIGFAPIVRLRGRLVRRGWNRLWRSHQSRTEARPAGPHLGGRDCDPGARGRRDRRRRSSPRLLQGIGTGLRDGGNRGRRERDRCRTRPRDAASHGRRRHAGGDPGFGRGLLV